MVASEDVAASKEFRLGNKDIGLANLKIGARNRESVCRGRNHSEEVSDRGRVMSP